MTVINNYSVSLALDASDYINDSRLSRKETAALTREINMARTPADKYERSITRIEKALQAEAIDQRVANQLKQAAAVKYKMVNAAMQRTTALQKLLSAGQQRVNSSMLGFGKAIGALLVGQFSLSAVRSGLSSMHASMLEIDETAKRARGMGIVYNDLKRLQLAASEFAGVDGPAFNNLLGRLQRRVGEAALGMGEARKAFDALGLSAADLANLNAAEQFDAVRLAVSRLENDTTQAAIALKIFDSEGKALLPLLKASEGAIGDYAATLEQLGVSLDDRAAKRIELVNDLLGRNKLAWEGLKNTILESQEIMGATVLVIQRIGTELGRVRKVMELGSSTFKALFGLGREGAAERLRRAQADTGLDYNLRRSVPEAEQTQRQDIRQTLSLLASGLGGAAEQLGLAAKQQFDTGQWLVRQQQNRERLGRQDISGDVSPFAPSAGRGTQEAYKIIAQARQTHEKKVEQQNNLVIKGIEQLSTIAGQQLAELARLVPIEGVL